MTPRLDDPSLYLKEARKLAARRSRDLWNLDGELDCTFLAAQPSAFFKRLSRDVSRDEHVFEPLLPHAAVVNRKPRTIYRVDPVDAVVWSTVVAVLSAAIEPRLPAQLYSYRKGRSQWGAAAAFSAYLRAHRAARPDPRTRGVYVVRRDVRRYDEHISTGAGSALWSQLGRLLQGRDLGLKAPLQPFLERLFRPRVRLADGSAGTLPSGIPTGIPTQTVGCNVYLLDVDAALMKFEGGFYARFGDDLLFAHPDHTQIEAAARQLDDAVGELGLTLNPDKSEAYWLTGPGCPSLHEKFAPVRSLPYLGFDVGFEGARLRSDKRRETWLSLKRRLDHAERLLAGTSPEERAQGLCGAVRSALDPRSPVADRYAGWLRMALFSRRDLFQLDHHLALEVAQRLSGRAGVRAFRDYPPRTLHKQYALPSLVVLWDEARRQGRR